MKKIVTVFLFLLSFSAVAYTQIPVATGVQILKAEDSLRYDSVLEGLMSSPNAAIRTRAALAAGRIGDEKAIEALAALLESDRNSDVRAMAAFALGEIESVKAGAVVLAAFKPSSGTELPNEHTAGMRPASVTARLIEAAGKIAAANAKDESAKALGKVILDVLDAEAAKANGQDRTTVLLGLTAVLRARPESGDKTVIKFLASTDARIRTDALNTLARLRAKVETKILRDLVLFDKDDAVRVNALRVIASSENKELNNLLIAALTDKNPAIRIAAIRSIATIKGDGAKGAADELIKQGEHMLDVRNKSRFRRPNENSELYEIATAIGRLIPGSANEKAVMFLIQVRAVDGYSSGETEIAFARVDPQLYLKQDNAEIFRYSDPSAAASLGQGLAEIASTKDAALMAQAGKKLTDFIAGMAAGVKPTDQTKMLKAMPDLTTAMAALKPDNLNEILLGQLKNADVFIRAAAAGAIADQPATKENVSALNTAFASAAVTDKHENDAQLAILDALVKLDKKAGVGSYSIALGSPDYLVRKKAFEILADKELETAYPGMTATVESERKNHKDQVLPYKSVFGTKLGQVLNTDVDYRRALSRRNGSIKAVVTTEKGTFTIVFYPEDAPLTVDNWVGLARAGYFNGLGVHRVVPNFVMQDGDPRGDGNGGPGWSIRCEVNMREYDRGAVGMALSGKDTGGSQWFVTHLPQPHLDGGYTVFGHVSEADMKVVDKIVRGDLILKVTIVGK